jgi:hypothetical protein
MTNDLCFCGKLRGVCDFSLQSSGCDDVAGLNMNLVNSPSDPVCRRELSLLKASFDVDVFALLVRHCGVGNVAIEDKAVPVRVGLGFAVPPDEMIRLAETDVGHLRAGRKKSQFWLSRQVTREFDPILLHDVIRTIRWPFWPGYGSTTARPADGSEPSEPG